MLSKCSVMQMTGMHRNKTKIYWVFSSACQANLDLINPWLLPHITLTLELLSWLCWCCSGSPLAAKMAFADGGIDEITWFYLLCARLDGPGPFPATIVNHNQSPDSSSPSVIGSVQSRVGQPWENHLPWPGVHSELRDMDRQLPGWVGQGETGNPWISWNALWVLSWVRAVFWESWKYFVSALSGVLPWRKNWFNL